MIVYTKKGGGSEDTTAEILQLYLKDNEIAVKNTVKLKSKKMRVFAYSRRKLYIRDHISGHFQIVKLDTANFDYLPNPKSYSALKNVWRVYKLKNCVLIHM